MTFSIPESMYPEILALLLLIAISWFAINARLVPNPIPGIPYNRFARYMPWGDLITLGWYNFTTGEVFSWFTLQCLHKKSPLVQLFIPSFSTTHPVLLLADIREVEDIVTNRVLEIDRADIMHTWIVMVASTASMGLRSSDKTFGEQRRLWSTILSPFFLETIAAPTFWKGSMKLAQLWERRAEVIRQEIGRDLAFDALDDIKLTMLEEMWKLSVGSDLGISDARLARLGAPKAVWTTWSDRVVFAQAQTPEIFQVLQTLLMCLFWIMQGVSPRMYTWFFTITGILSRTNDRKYKILIRTVETSKQHVRFGKEETDTCALDLVIRKHYSAEVDSRVSAEGDFETALMDELFQLLITGHETTSSTIAWALKYLTDNPGTQTELRSALCAAYHGSSATPSARMIFAASIPYLDAVIAETLRISNPIPVSFRQTQIQCDILGHSIPAGTPVYLITAGPSCLSPGMPEIPEYLRSRFSQATFRRREERSIPVKSDSSLADFEPARWLRLDGSFDIDAVKTMPFSAGRRGCFGKRIAMLELKTMLTILIMRFKFPKLEQRFSGYAAVDGLTRRPASCYVMPMPVKRET